MVTIATLKSLYIQDYMGFFRTNGVDNWQKRIIGNISNEKIISVKKIIEEELVKEQKKFDENDLDDFLFQRLFYEDLGHQHIYRYSNLVFSENTSRTDIEDFFSNNPSLLLDNLITQDCSLDDFSLYTTRLEWEDEKLFTINMLFRLTSIDAKSYTDVDCFFGVRIDLINKLIVLKFNSNYMEKSGMEPLAIVKKVRNILQFESIQNEFQPYTLNIISLNEVEVRKTIFQLFQKSSLEAETILNTLVPTDVDDKIKDFLVNQMYMQTPGSDYIAQIKAVVYQEVTKKIGSVSFIDGWVYRFSFREGETTRASSRTDDYGPIYGSKIYWHLKDVIFKEKEMYEVGLHFYLSENAANKDQYVLVKLESKNNTLILNYYHKLRKIRKDGEHFVLQKINEYLP